MSKKVSQSDKFKHAAQELGCDEDEGRFKTTLRNIARAHVEPEDRKKPKRQPKARKGAGSP